MKDIVVSSGSDVIDELLNGGFEVDVVNTLYGPSGSGKTTLCLLAAIRCAAAGKKVIFIDSEGGFSMTRLSQITSDQNVLENILLLKPTTFTQQMQFILKLKSMINEKIGLIVVDTISMLYRLELGQKSDGVKHVNSQLGTQIAYLTEIARNHQIPILVTNQVYSDFDERDSVRMVGGDLLHYGSKCLIQLKKFKTRRVAIVRKHRSIPENKTITFEIIEEGIVKKEEKYKE